ncbi:MAG TPA: molybdopterin-guanine dinucleotide biosynthesis protein B, partial [Usitatibacter sp.]|nr:molybdopterin-guanine dinucleotide biosynthesis protein B [Usitatibacter sp.]
MKVIGIAGFSGSGKTTLIEKVIPELVKAGLRVSLIKHAHHEFDIDHAGKDSYRHRHAGCAEVLVSSPKRWALMHELRGAPEPSLQEQLRQFSPCDLVIVEGYKNQPIPKVEVHRRAAKAPLLYPDDPNVVAIATDEPLETSLPQLPLADPAAVARLFPEEGSELPRLAAERALRRRLTVIAGGPGTGKTTTVARGLALLHGRAVGGPAPLIALAAPTGKAAARLQEAVHDEAEALDVSAAVRERLRAATAS